MFEAPSGKTYDSRWTLHVATRLSTTCPVPHDIFVAVVHRFSTSVAYNATEWRSTGTDRAPNGNAAPGPRDE